MKKHTIYVENLKCGGCANTINKAISKFSGVQQVNVDAVESRIDIETDDSEDQILAIKQKLVNLGYPEAGTQNTIVTAAKSYVSCAIGRMGSKA